MTYYRTNLIAREMLQNQQKHKRKEQTCLSGPISSVNTSVYPKEDFKVKTANYKEKQSNKITYSPRPVRRPTFPNKNWHL